MNLTSCCGLYSPQKEKRFLDSVSPSSLQNMEASKTLVYMQVHSSKENAQVIGEAITASGLAGAAAINGLASVLAAGFAGMSASLAGLRRA